MSEIQRWADPMHPPGLMLDPDGEYVTYADHVAAMIAEGGAARNYGYEQGQRDERDRWSKVTEKPDGHALGVYNAGRSDERERIRTGVTGLNPSYQGSGAKWLVRDAVLAVIDGEDSA